MKPIGKRPDSKPPRTMAVLGMASLLATVVMASADISDTIPAANSRPAARAVELPKSMRSGAQIDFELWSWSDDEGGRSKLRDLKDGDRIPMEGLPDLVQFRFRILGEHNGVTFQGRSADGEHQLGWAEDRLQFKPGEPPAQRIYRAQPSGYFPQPGRYALEVKGRKDGVTMGEAVINIEFVKAPPKPLVRAPVYAASVGRMAPLPKSMQIGAAVHFELWQWANHEGVKKLLDLKDGIKVPVETLPSTIGFLFYADAEFDVITCSWHSTDGPPQSFWAHKDVPLEKSGRQTPYRSSNLGFFPQIGQYALEVKAEKSGKIVA